MAKGTPNQIGFDDAGFTPGTACPVSVCMLERAWLQPAADMTLELDNRNTLVAGGSRGIGRSIAMAFAGAGANVSICARGVEALRATVAEL